MGANNPAGEELSLGIDYTSVIEVAMPALKSIIAFTVSFVGFASDFLTVVVSVVGLWITWSNRNRITKTFSILLNWTYHITLMELFGKLDRLNLLKATRQKDLIEIQNIFGEIHGQIKGSAQLRKKFHVLLPKLENLSRGVGLDEPKKRSIVSEVRQILREIEIELKSPEEGF